MGNNLQGKKIVVTRTRSQASVLVDRLVGLGADVIEIPTIKILPPDNRQEFVEGVAQVHTYDWIVFTSPNGVERFFEAYYTAYKDARSIGGAKIAAVGPSTAEKINSYRFAVDLMPDKYVAEDLVKKFAKTESMENLTVLWVRGSLARNVVAQGLMALGAIVDECVAYKTVAEDEDPTGGKARYTEEGVDAVTFASSSSVENFLNMGIQIDKSALAISMGPITSETLRENGFTNIVEAKSSTIDSLVSAVKMAL